MWTETDVEEDVAERLLGERMLEVHLVETADPKVPDTRDVQAPPPLPEPISDPAVRLEQEREEAVERAAKAAETTERLAASAEAERQARTPDFDDDDLARSPVQPPPRRRGR